MARKRHPLAPPVVRPWFAAAPPEARSQFRRVPVVARAPRAPASTALRAWPPRACPTAPVWPGAACARVASTSNDPPRAGRVHASCHGKQRRAIAVAAQDVGELGGVGGE